MVSTQSTWDTWRRELARSTSIVIYPNQVISLITMKNAIFFFFLFSQVLFICAQDKVECESDADCMEFGQCIDNKCECQQGFVEVRKWLKKVCLPYSTQDNAFSCEADEQCSLIQDESNPKGNPATCSLFRRVCACKEGTWFPTEDEGNAGNPICARGFDSACETDQQCERSIPNGVCLENKCTCGEDYVKMEDEHMCLPYATDESNECLVDEQCARMHDSRGHLFNKHPRCDNETASCVCHTNNWALNNSTCVRGAGARCGLLLPCGVDNSKCKLLKHRCECEEGFVANEETHYCEEDVQFSLKKRLQTRITKVQLKRNN